MTWEPTMRIALAALLLTCCTAQQLAAAKAALQTCGTDAALAEVQNLLPVVTAVVTSQPVNAEAILTSLEHVSETGAICSLQQLANQPAARLATPGALGALSPQAFAAKLLAERAN